MSFLGDLFGGGKHGGVPSAPLPPPSPSATNATNAANATVADQRAALLYAGGQTDYTGGLGILTGSDISSKSLIGN